MTGSLFSGPPRPTPAPLDRSRGACNQPTNRPLTPTLLPPLRRPLPTRSFFGGGGFPFGGQQQEEQTPKGDTVKIELEVSLKDLYLGAQFKVGSWRGGGGLMEGEGERAGCWPSDGGGSV